MKNSLYLECASGISGDMFVAMLLDLGADAEYLQKQIASIPVEGTEVKIGRVKKAGLDMCDFSVLLDEAHENHDHDMEYLYGKDREHGLCDHSHGHEHSHTLCDHSHDHEHSHTLCDQSHHHEHSHEHTVFDQSHHHAHSHRNLTEVMDILRSGSLTEEEVALAEKIFKILAEAESAAHGVPETEVHFHEVGAVDSIIDIAAAAICFLNLKIDRVYIPAITEGSGSVRCQHGILPVPVPAVANIAASYSMPLLLSDKKGELVTPTGAAIAAAVCTDQKLPSQYRIRRIGMGAGKRKYDFPNFLRGMLLDVSDTEEDKILKIECNIDDCTGETLGYTLERLFEAGARDVYFTPVYMKKNRPGVLLSVICIPSDRLIMENIIFQETSTIGMRYQLMERTVLSGKIKTFVSSVGEVRVKYSVYGDFEKCYPEYEDIRVIAKEKNIPFEKLYQKILTEISVSENAI